MLTIPNTDRIMDWIMRFSPPAIALSLVLATVSSAGFGQSETSPVDPRSLAYQQQAMQAREAGRLDQAIGLYETALALDPSNRGAFSGLAEVARAQGLPGKAVHFYREALQIDPNDLGALTGEGETLAERGALEKARQNLARIRLLCRGDCASGDTLAAAIEAAENKPVMSASAVAPRPTVGEEVDETP